MTDNLPKEYFDLIRKVVREKNQNGTTNERPLKRRRRHREKLPPLNSQIPTDPDIIVNLDSDDDGNFIDDNNQEQTPQSEPIDVVNQLDVEEIHSEGSSPTLTSVEPEESVSEYDSDDFEDVSDTEPNEDKIKNISVTIHKKTEPPEVKKSQVRNMCSNEEKKRRKSMHKFQLLCLMCHGSIRNRWLNTSKLMRKLNKLIPDKTLELLHPKRDNEMILRSTRKLLDGLKQSMEIWQKHWKIVQKYHNSTGLYMKMWDELSNNDTRSNITSSQLITKQTFIRQVLKGVGDRDVATQGFVALLRSCNVNARLIMSCQPCDFTNLKENDVPCRASYDDMVKYPIFWCEVWDKFSKQWISIDPMNLKTIEQIRHSTKMEPKGVMCCKRNMIRYVIAYDRQEGCRDVTRRYVKWLNAKTRRRRIAKDSDGLRWYQAVLETLHRRKRTKIDDYEDEYFQVRNEDEGMPDCLADMKSHPYYILERDLHSNQVLCKGCKECGYLNLPNNKGLIKVYARRDILDLKSGRQWYNEGRILKKGSQYLKVVQRKTREGEMEDERLYPVEATETYMPPLATYPLGEITKNTFGNLEVFVPSMIPGNCCLVESPVAIKAAKFLGIQFAPAVTKFKFERGSKAKAMISGVVVAVWFREAMVACIDGIEYVEEENKRQEEEIWSLESWRVFLTKMRIKEDLNNTYGVVNESEMQLQEEAPEETPEEEEFGGGGGFFVNATTPMDKSSLHQEEEEEEEAEECIDTNHEDPPPDEIDDEYATFMDDIS